MADKQTEKAPPSPPPAPVAKPATPTGKAGFDPLRPLRYAIGFVKGTFYHTFDKTAVVGRLGSWVGAGIGILMAISGAGLWMIPIGFVTGLAAGAIGGGMFGLATGGIRGMARNGRAEKYAEDLAAKETAKAARPSAGMGVDYRDVYRARQQQNNFILDRLQQQERETRAEERHATWAERVGHGGHGGGRGF